MWATDDGKAFQLTTVRFRAPMASNEEGAFLYTCSDGILRHESKIQPIGGVYPVFPGLWPDDAHRYVKDNKVFETTFHDPIGGPLSASGYSSHTEQVIMELYDPHNPPPKPKVVKKIRVEYEDGTAKSATGADAQAIFEHWKSCECFWSIHGGKYVGPCLQDDNLPWPKW